jgi:hypothetical protein
VVHERRPICDAANPPRSPPILEAVHVSLSKADLERRLTMTATNPAPTVPLETTYLRQPPQQPLRHLDPDVARSIADAKTRTGLSWRRLAALTGVSHPHLVLLSQGKRVPSTVTAERIIVVLPMTPDEQVALLGAAVADRGKSRPAR